ncbi:MAG TPA: nucleoside/nucleotide kinase family protein [Microcella sp.]|nr:nucleoside/nucleotide kinase family protein [Microcella sp.]
MDQRDGHGTTPPHVTGAEHEIIAQLSARLIAAADAENSRVIVGICGAPGAGKSRLADALAETLGAARAVVVPFDGFHLATSVIAGTPLMSRRGALDTFDLGAFRSIIERIRRRDDDIVYAPTYRRGLEEPIASAIPVPRDVPIIITEGNYLLLDEPALVAARAHLNEVWYLDTPNDVRLPQLVARHVAFGKPVDEAAAWATGTDQRNAELIESTRDRADLLVTVVRDDAGAMIATGREERQPW